MDYPETLRFLFSQLPMYQRIGAAAYKTDLDNTIRICERLGNPQNDFPSVHIAGTNGKGSVAHMIASVLQQAGYTTGLYTSPHLVDFRERIRINGEMIPKQEVVAFVDENRSLLDDIKPSFFEYTFGMAMRHFARQNVDIAVVETGMGGRLDSTNIVRPVCSVITNIGFDHMRFLGDTLPKIAAEKAGIIKAGVPVVIGETQEETTGVFERTAAAAKAPVLFADQQWRIHRLTADAGQGACRLESLTSGEKLMVELPFGGDYQLKNMLAVVTVADSLVEAGYKIGREQFAAGIKHAIRNTGLAGRWDVLQQKPLVICDTGHNKDGLRAVITQLRSLPCKHLHMVFGTVEDKDLTDILNLLPQEATYYFCKPSIPRGLDQEVLQKKARAHGLSGKSYASVSEAFETAKRQADEDDVVFAGGSTFVVAEVLQARQ